MARSASSWWSEERTSSTVTAPHVVGRSCNIHTCTCTVTTPHTAQCHNTWTYIGEVAHGTVNGITAANASQRSNEVASSLQRHHLG